MKITDMKTNKLSTVGGTGKSYSPFTLKPILFPTLFSFGDDDNDFCPLPCIRGVGLDPNTAPMCVKLSAPNKKLILRLIITQSVYN